MKNKTLKIGSYYCTPNKGTVYKILHFAKSMDNNDMNVVFCVFSKALNEDTNKIYIRSIESFTNSNLIEYERESVE